MLTDDLVERGEMLVGDVVAEEMKVTPVGLDWD